MATFNESNMWYNGGAAQGPAPKPMAGETNMWYNGGSAQGPAPQSAAQKAYPRDRVLGDSTTTPSSSSTDRYGLQPGQNPTTTYRNVNGRNVKVSDLINEGYFDQQSPSVTGPSEQEINDIYNPSVQYLDQAEGQLRSDLPTYINEANMNAETNKTLLGNKKSAAAAQLEQQQTSATQRKEDAISASRRLYAELQRANQQRFGGSSSAGQAASELQGVEMQRNRGTINQDFGNTVKQIQDQRMSVENDYQGGLQQIETQKQAAINNVNREFQNKLLEINRQRGELSSAKAQARLQALQEMRNKVFQIQQSNYQMKQELDAQRAAAELELEMNAKKFAQSAAQGQSGLNSYMGRTTTSPTSVYGVSSQSVAPQALPTGQISPTAEDPMQSVGYVQPTRSSNSIVDALRGGMFGAA